MPDAMDSSASLLLLKSMHVAAKNFGSCQIEARLISFRRNALNPFSVLTVDEANRGSGTVCE